MRGLLIFAACAAFAAAANAADKVPIRDSSFRDGYGHRVQQLSVVVDAPVAKVWDAFMTDDGFTRWATPVAHVTVENGGGMMESSYRLSSKIGDPDNIKNEIVAYLPDRMIALRNAHVPKGAPFDPVLISSIRTVITFDDLGGKTSSPNRKSAMAKAPVMTRCTSISAMVMPRNWNRLPTASPAARWIGKPKPRR